MNGSKIIDTNILIRLFTEEDSKLSKEASEILQSAEKVIIYPLVLAETIWVLLKNYEFKKSDLVFIISFLDNSKFIIPERKEINLTLELFLNSKLSFIDSYLAIKSKVSNIELATFDKDLDKSLKILKSKA